MIPRLLRIGICCLIRGTKSSLPLLKDDDGKVSTDWKIYVYPSSYLVDRQGIISYAYLGALEWDSTETIKTIQRLLKRP